MSTVYIGPIMKKITEATEQKVNLYVKKYHLTLSQAKVVVFLTQKEGHQATQKEIEYDLSVSHPTTVTIVKSMISKNMLKVCEDPNDKRMKVLKLTWGDESKYEDLQQNALGMEDQLLSDFSSEEKIQLKKMLERCFHNISK